MMHIIIRNKYRTVYLEGSLHHHYNERRQKKAQKRADLYSGNVLGLINIDDNKGKKLEQALDQDLKKRSIKEHNHDATGFEAGKHYFGYIFVSVGPKEDNQIKQEDQIFDTENYKTIKIQGNDKETKKWLEDADIATDDESPVLWVVFHPRGKNDIYIKYTRFGQILDTSDKFNDENADVWYQGNIKKQRLVIIGAPKSGKKTLQRYLKQRYQVDSVIMGRNQALINKKKYQRHVTILKCCVKYRDTLMHRLIKAGYRYNRAEQILDQYHNGKIGIDKWYDDGALEDFEHPVMCNNSKNMKQSINKILAKKL